MLSLFVMDVSGSTKLNNSEKISQMLEKLTADIHNWTKDLSFSYVNFRMGDELFFVCDSVSVTLLTSFYIKLLWPFKAQPVKFGISASHDPLPEGNLEHWNAPVIKQARTNLSKIKQSDVSDFFLTINGTNVDVINNVLYPYLTEITNQHSDMQRKAVLLSYCYTQQKEIAETLNKSISTISEHLKKGHKKQLTLIEAALQNIDETDDLKLNINDTFKEYAK
ncbi:hypothetical protein ACMGE7_05835 [Macrococcus equi]|uniref:hypothetical protein n=1 Tax=Macrococcus equi TaxID=3395462 RepID=UPI0039BE22AB